MDEDTEVLELGSSRGKWVTAALIAVVVVAVLGRYLLTRGSGSPAAQHPPTHVSSSASGSPVSVPAPAPLPASVSVAVGSERMWPTRSGACGNTAYLPLVTAHRLDRATGVRALVGDRLATVDVDSGTTRPAALPPGKYASALATADDGTYALLSPCADIAGAPVTVVRLDTSGTVRTVAHGAYDQLLPGGKHVWGVLSNESGTTTWLDPLDGGQRLRMPRDFIPVGAYGDVIVGTHSPPNMAQGAASPLQLLDASTDRVVRTIGGETAATVSEGLVLWIGPGCTRCRVHTYDLRTGVSTTTRAEVPSSGGLWNGVVSPDRRTVAMLRQRSRPAPYDMGHPGNPNEIVTLDLRSGVTRTVPGVVLFAKAAPGLAFSSDGRWLVISLDEGTSVRLLLWRAGLAAPLQSPVQLTAKVAFAPGVAALG